MIATRQGFKVHRLVWFVIESLTPEERAQVESVLKSPERFAELAARPGAVREFATLFGPHFAMNIPPGYVLIFQKTEEGVDIRDIMSQAAVDYLRSTGSDARGDDGARDGAPGS